MSDSPAVVTLSINDGDRIDGIADASSLLAVGTAYKASVADQRLEQGEKLLSSIVGNVTSTQAASAIGNLMASDVTKKATAEILHVANKVLGALDALSAVHPFIGLAVVAFKGIVQFEMNDEKTTSALNHLNDPDQVLPAAKLSAADYRSPLTRQIVLASIKDMGNCFNKYHQSKPISRFFKAMQWEDKFIGLADTFTGLKKDVKTALIIRTAIRIEDAATGVERLDVKLEILMDMIRTKPTAEQKVADAVASRGGKEAVLNDTSKIQEVIKATTVVDKKHDSSNARVDASLLYETPNSFGDPAGRKSTAVRSNPRDQDQRAQAGCSSHAGRILYALNKGAFTRIKDPHIRYIWRSMKWTLSVQTAKFVPALCDYFSEQVGISKHHDTHQSTVSSPPSPSLTAQSRTGGDEEEEGPPAVSSDDEWCLVCLHLPTLKEALDDDFNGLVNVSEVNNFARSKSMPADWSILKRLAYASEGWNIERYTYALKIQALVNSRLTNQDSPCQQIARVKQVARGVKEMVSAGSSEIYELIDERTSRHESYLESILDKIKYEIPSTDALFVYFESDHLEHYIMPLLFLILRHHARIARLARNIVLDRRELEQASSTLHVVIDCAIARARKLAGAFFVDLEIFQQLGLDEAAKFAAYAGGMYRILWASSPMPNEYEYWRKYSGDAEDLGIDLDTLSDASALRYGAPDQ
ncbi:hypothetical protein BKA62DRAFT_771732 [Auriculariales sp. MPI-PUGE-AT-0066]|nr:hypothetical protein BKA62DRAFT_771732 [Auriculariales sp. MPI-PUGE-AT-0066]